MLGRLILLPLLMMAVAAYSNNMMIPSPPAIAAKSYILMDADTGAVIAERDADIQLDPASLTKVMTAYVADYEVEQGNISLDDVTTVSKQAWAKNFQGSSLMFLEVGKKVKVVDLMKGVIISSGNDASVALAEHTEGNVGAFVDLMNQHAKHLGMTNTHFENVHGLTSKNHLTTARDLAKLAQSAIKSFPERYKFYSEKSYTYNGIKQYNRNRLLWRDPSVDGMKTGHTDKAGYCLIASAKRDDMRLIAVVLGAKSEESRAKEAQKLFSYGFRYYETVKVYEKGQVAKEVKIWGGEKPKVALIPSKDIFVTVPKSQVEDLEAQVSVNKYLEAPIEKGDILAELILKAEGKVLSKTPLIAKDAVDEGSFFKRFWAKIKLFFVKLIG